MQPFVKESTTLEVLNLSDREDRLYLVKGVKRFDKKYEQQHSKRQAWRRDKMDAEEPMRR